MTWVFDTFVLLRGMTRRSFPPEVGFLDEFRELSSAGLVSSRTVT